MKRDNVPEMRKDHFWVEVYVGASNWGWGRGGGIERRKQGY